MTPSIVVVGSVNMDLVMRMERAPTAGETLTGRDFATLPGGKGANQAVACARMGASVAMVGVVGGDAHGTALRSALEHDGIACDHLRTAASTASGVAMIWVEDNGQNRIVLAPGANGSMEVDDIDRAAELIGSARMMIAQLEVPMYVVEAAVGRAHAAGVGVLLNPAPAVPLPDAMWLMVDVLVVNETEAAVLSGIEVIDAASAMKAGMLLRERGPARVLITLGEQGVVATDAQGARHSPARAVQAVDTTAAGDTFIGALAVALCEGQSLDDAVALGQAASALCVTRHGAQASIPYRRELSP
jgi:ribokinase